LVSSGVRLFTRFAVFLLAWPSLVTACQETPCILFEASGIYATLKDLYGKPVQGATLLIRDASPEARGPMTICSFFEGTAERIMRRGPIAKRLGTDRDGDFDLRGLRPGYYWVTYMQKDQGESFLLQLTDSKGRSRFNLVVGGYIRENRCYTIDIERNETKPPGWRQVPVLPQQLSRKRAAKIRERVLREFKAGAYLKLELHDGRQIEGKVSEVRADDFLVTDGVRISTVPFTEVKKIRGSRRP